MDSDYRTALVRFEMELARRSGDRGRERELQSHLNQLVADDLAGQP
ncbi:hypothetical protein [Tomitella gaofuii]|nr:hypothetical protein [Tomitella gaofuii]